VSLSCLHRATSGGLRLDPVGCRLGELRVGHLGKELTRVPLRADHDRPLAMARDDALVEVVLSCPQWLSLPLGLRFCTGRGSYTGIWLLATSSAGETVVE